MSLQHCISIFSIKSSYKAVNKLDWVSFQRKQNIQLKSTKYIQNTADRQENVTTNTRKCLRQKYILRLH